MTRYNDYYDDYYSRPEDQVVKYCREAFKNNYKRYWIDTLNKEDKEVMNEFKKVEVDLYPKNINLREELIKRGVKAPPKMKMKKPKKPKRNKYNSTERYEEALEKYKGMKKKYYRLLEKNKEEWAKYKSVVYELIHKDIDYEKNKGTIPIHIKIEQTKTSNNKEPKKIIKRIN